MNTGPRHAEDLFCFGVYTASHAINRAYAPHLKRLGLTYPQYITLTLLWERDGQNVNALARHLGMETSTVTPLVKRLEALGLVARVRGTEDKREVQVHLTSTGRALQDEAPGITSCMIEATTLSVDQLDTLQRLLLVLRDNLRATTEGSTDQPSG